MGKMKTTEDGWYGCDFRSLNTHQDIHYNHIFYINPSQVYSEENGWQCEFYQAVESVQEKDLGMWRVKYWLGKISQWCVFCVDVHVQCLVEHVLHVCFVWMFMSSVWLNVFFMLFCVDVHDQCLVERVLHVCLCGCSCPVCWLTVFFMCVCVDVHVQCLVERVLHVFVWMFMSSVWFERILHVCVCVDVHVRVWLNVFFMCVFVWMFMSSVWSNVFFMCVLCGCSCPVFGRTCSSCVFVWMFTSSVWFERVLHVCVCVDVHVQCLVERVLHVCVCVDVHVQCLVERVLHVCLCGCSCPVFGRTCSSCVCLCDVHVQCLVERVLHVCV